MPRRAEGLERTPGQPAEALKSPRHRVVSRRKWSYVHSDPGRAGLCERPEDYLWPSGWMWERSMWSVELGLRIDDELTGALGEPSKLNVCQNRSWRDHLSGLGEETRQPCEG